MISERPEILESFIAVSAADRQRSCGASIEPFWQRAELLNKATADVSAATGPGKAATANVASVARPHAPTNIKLSGQNGQLMLKSDKLELERGAAAKTENQDR